MNWLLIGVIALIVLCVLYGYFKGFIKIVFSLVSIIVLVAFVTITTPYIGTFLEEKTSLPATIEAKCLENLQSLTEKNVEQGMQEQATDKQGVLEGAGIQLPDKIWEQMLNSGIDAADTALEESGIYESVAKSMAHFIINGIASLIALIIGIIALFIIARLLNIVSKLPVIKEVNHSLGVVSGLVLGLVIIWLFFYLVAILCTSSFGIMMTDYIQRSTILTWLYDNNMILYLIMIFL